MKFLRICSLLLALLMVLTVFAACGDKPGEKDTTQGDKQPTSQETKKEPSETESETEPAIVPTTLPEKHDYGFELNVLHWTVGGQGVGEKWIPWEEIAVEEDTGDGIVRAVFERNNLLETDYGIHVNTEYMDTDPITATIKNLVSTNDDAYQLVVQRGYQFQFLMTTNSFGDMSDIRTMDLSKPWYNQDSVNTFTFGGNTIMAASDLLLLDKGATACMFYNKNLAAEHDYADNYFYNMVNDYTWTLEKVVEVMENTYKDTTGDGYTIDDIFGCTGGDDPMHFIFNGAGERFCTTDPDKYLVYTFYSERAIDIVEDTLNDLCLSKAYFSDVNYSEASQLTNPFQSDLVFFSFSCIKGVNELRSMVSEYGILPIPQYEASQHQYYSEISPHHGSLFAVPSTSVQDDEEANKIGVALEYMSYISSQDVYPELYNVVLEGKGTRDPQSREMLKLIFDTRMYDIGIIFDFARFADGVLRLPKHQEQNVSTLWASNEEVIDEELGKTVEALQKIG